MWTTLLVLAIAVNFEPTRLGLVTFILIRPRPMPQLLAFFVGSFLTSASAGLLVLFVLHHGIPTGSRSTGAMVQITLGVVALIVAAFLASNISVPVSGRRAPVDATATTDADSSEAEVAQPRLVQWLSARAGQLVKGSSPWFAFALGVGIAIPSVDYLALLVLIATSGVALSTQVTALLLFLSIANVVLLIPIAGHLLAPERTRVVLERLRDWVLARRRRDYAVIVAVAGALMVLVGLNGL